MKKSTSAPVLRPIQSLCSFLMLAGQSTSSRSFSSRSAYAVIRSIHCRSGMPHDGMAAAFAHAADDFFVGQHRAQRRAPVHRRFVLDTPADAHPDSAEPLPRRCAITSAGIGSSLIGRPALLLGIEPGVEQHQENPLRPAEIFGVGRRQFAIPVVAEAEHFQLPAEVGDVLLGRSPRRHALC